MSTAAQASANHILRINIDDGKQVHLTSLLRDFPFPSLDMFFAKVTKTLQAFLFPPIQGRFYGCKDTIFNNK